MALALVAAAIASEHVIAEGTILPRQFAINGRAFLIENGVARDMLRAEMIAVEPGATIPEQEQFRLTRAGCTAVLNLVGRPRLVDLGVADAS
jgi:hypothetical protein